MDFYCLFQIAWAYRSLRLMIGGKNKNLYNKQYTEHVTGIKRTGPDIAKGIPSPIAKLSIPFPTPPKNVAHYSNNLLFSSTAKTMPIALKRQLKI